jgi:hypothetical protein
MCTQQTIGEAARLVDPSPTAMSIYFREIYLLIWN